MQDVEILINPEIREYKEAVFFGLDLRQLICAGCGIAMSVALFFLLPNLPTTIKSWICMVGAMPFMAVAFLKFSGMTADKYFIAFVRSEFMMPKVLKYETASERAARKAKEAEKKKGLLRRGKNNSGQGSSDPSAAPFAELNDISLDIPEGTYHADPEVIAVTFGGEREPKPKRKPEPESAASADHITETDADMEAQEAETPSKSKKKLPFVPTVGKRRKTKAEKKAEWEREQAERPKPVKSSSAGRVKNKLDRHKRPPIPKTAQDAIPIKSIWPDGIALMKDGRYSKTWKFSDVNYQVASYEEKLVLLERYAGILKAIDPETQLKITLLRDRINQSRFEEQTFVPLKDDGHDDLRMEYNSNIAQKQLAVNESTTQDRFVTITVSAKDITGAKAMFARINSDLWSLFQQIGSRCDELNSKEYLQLLRGFYFTSNRQNPKFNKKFKDDVYIDDVADLICPETFQFATDYIRIGDQYARALRFVGFPARMYDSFVSKLFSLVNRKISLSIDVSSMATDEAVRMLDSILLGVETDIANYIRRQNQNQNFTADPPRDLARKRENVQGMLDEIQSNDQRILLATITIVHQADTPAQLDADSATLMTKAQESSCELDALRYRQYEGICTALPYGSRMMHDSRTFLSGSAAAFLPFCAQELSHPGGICYGLNAISNNLILADRRLLKNGNGYILGTSGTGKSMAAKYEILYLLLNTKDHVIIMDPQNEYGPFADEFPELATMIDLSPTSKDHINALDLSLGYGEEENPIISKTQFVMSFFEELTAETGKHRLGAKERSIIDRCLTNIYSKYFDSGYTIAPPTLVDLHDELMRQYSEKDELEARDLALALESVSIGNLNMFAHQTNVNVHNRLLIYGIRELGSQMKNLGMLTMIDSIRNRVAQNRRSGIRTHVFIDEMHVFFRNDLSAEFFSASWKQFRKDNAVATGITQNIEDVLSSTQGCTMLANSEWLVLFSQGATDREKLKSLLNISPTQLGYITEQGVGKGIIKCEHNMIPFYNIIDKNTKTYKLMSTKPMEFQDVV